MRELKDRVKIYPDFGQPFICLYYKTKIKSEVDCNVPTFGIEIEKEVSSIIIENKKIDDISICEEEIDELLKKLVDYKVTPVTLKDIVIDWIGAVII